MLRYNDEDRSVFSTGYSPIIYRPATEQEITPRIFIQVSFQGMETTAFVDTGAPYLICDPEIASTIGLQPENGAPIKNVDVRGSQLNGHLHRLIVTLIAEEGEDLPVDATVFVPEMKPYQEWSAFPSILGLNTFLDRIRFAVDPEQARFYFGGLGTEEL